MSEDTWQSSSLQMQSKHVCRCALNQLCPSSDSFALTHLNAAVLEQISKLLFLQRQLWVLLWFELWPAQWCHNEDRIHPRWQGCLTNFPAHCEPRCSLNLENDGWAILQEETQVACGYRVTTLHGDLKALADNSTSSPASSRGVGTKQGWALSVASVGFSMGPGLAVYLSLSTLDITTKLFAENHGYNLKAQFSLSLEKNMNGGKYFLLFSMNFLFLFRTNLCLCWLFVICCMSEHLLITWKHSHPINGWVGHWLQRHWISHPHTCCLPPQKNVQARKIMYTTLALHPCPPTMFFS